MTIIKKAFSALSRYKLFTALNVLGLTIVLTVVYILLIPVYNSLTWNRGIKDCDRIYVLTHNFRPSEPESEYFPQGMVRLLCDDNPYVECYSHKSDCEYLIVDNRAIGCLRLRRELINLYNLKITAGSWERLFDYDGCAVSCSYAKKQMLNIGDTIKLWDHTSGCKIVSAIFKDFPKNSQWGLIEIIRDGSHDYDIYGQQWNVMYSPLLVKLHKETQEKEFLNHFIMRVKELKINEYFIKDLTSENVEQYIHLTPLDEIFFTPQIGKDSHFYRGRLEDTLLMMTLAIILFAIAFINYFNLFTAIIPWRIRSINTQKIMGAYTIQLRSELLIESLILVIASLFFSYIAINYLNDTNTFRSWSLIGGLLPSNNIDVTIIIVCASVVTALFAALYPTWYITSFTPSFVLKGRFAATASGKQLRYALVCLQFVASFFFVTAGFLTYQQFNSRSNSDWGICFDNIYQYGMNHNIEYEITPQMLPTVYNRFKGCEQVEEVTFMHTSFTNYNGLIKTTFHNHPDKEKRENKFNFVHVYHNFIETMGIDIISGRGFNSDDIQKAPVAIINETMQKEFNIGIGDMLRIYERGIDDRAVIVGICRDFYHHDLHRSIEPLALIHSPKVPLYESLIKTTEECNLTYLNNSITSELKNLEPNTSLAIPVFQLKTKIENIWLSAEQSIIKILIPISITAVIVALLGVFGLVALETRYRRKEIAIRRVNGALVKDILILFNKQFLYILIGCFVFTIPLLIYAFEQWQQDFAQKIPLHVWPFAVSFFLVALLTAAIITIGAWRVVTQNPIEVIGNGE